MQWAAFYISWPSNQGADAAEKELKLHVEEDLTKGLAMVQRELSVKSLAVGATRWYRPADVQSKSRLRPIAHVVSLYSRMTLRQHLPAEYEEWLVEFQLWLRGYLPCQMEKTDQTLIYFKCGSWQ